MFSCPKCGEKKKLYITALVTVLLKQGADEDSIETESIDNNYEWDDASSMSCGACHYESTVMGFDEEGR